MYRTAKGIAILLLLYSSLSIEVSSQSRTRPENFRSVVESKLKKQGVHLNDVCAIDTDSAARRIFVEYGAIFVSDNKNAPPAKCIFDDEAEVNAFQSGIKKETQNIAGVAVTLQSSAMNALIAARADAARSGLNITPRGGTDASSRTFADTLRLWNTRFLPALDHWTTAGKITKKDADAARRAAIPEQIKKVLEWEQIGLYFSKDLTKSILYSVAAPGASQHLFMLALDVTQYSDPEVRRILAEHGWFQTVKSDMPHFTYLGAKESELPSLGLKPVKVGSQIFWIPNFE